jgi:transposase-like protein
LTEQELTRRAKRRLAIIRHVEEVTGNVALTCRYYGISRQCYYLWYRRWQAEGLAGLRDRSSRPLVCPNTTRTEVVGKIIYRASTTTSARPRSRCTCGATTTSRSATRACGGSSNAPDLNRLPASQRYQRHDRRWKRYEKPLPGHQVQIDVKFIQPLPRGPSPTPGASTTSSPPSKFLGEAPTMDPIGVTSSVSAILGGWPGPATPGPFGPMTRDDAGPPMTVVVRGIRSFVARMRPDVAPGQDAEALAGLFPRTSNPRPQPGFSCGRQTSSGEATSWPGTNSMPRGRTSSPSAAGGTPASGR